MQRTDHFRRQHQELVDICARMTPLLADAAAQAGALRDLLSMLAGKLSVHLAMEDNGLYPRLRKHGDAGVRSIVERYESEMSGIKEAFVGYVSRWPTAKAIEAAPAAFAQETRAIFAALTRRIEMEDGELYPLLDKADASTSA